MASMLIRDGREGIGRRGKGYVNTKAKIGTMQATSQGTLGANRRWKKQGSLLSRLWREYGPPDLLSLEFWSPEMLGN